MDDSSAAKQLLRVQYFGGQADEFIDFAAQDDAFLDSMSEMLQLLADECSRALEWSSESEAITADAVEAFESLVGVCKDAGLVIADSEGVETCVDIQVIAYGAEAVAVDSQEKEPFSLTIEIPSPGFSASGVPTRDPVSTRSCAPANSKAWTPRHHADSSVGSFKPVPSGDDQQHVVSPMRREEIIEIELTDLLTHTHEEMELCRRELSHQLHQADTRHAEAQAQAHTVIQALQHTLETSQETMSRIQQEVHDTRQSMTALQSSVLQSQQAMEVALKDQAREWKAICNDLIVEKRNVAKKLAEERGKCAALKEHLTMHDNQRRPHEQWPSPRRRQELNDTTLSRSSRAQSELEPEDNPTASPVYPANSRLAASKKSSGDNDFELLHADLYSNGDEGFLYKSGLRSPSSPSLSQAESACTPARKLKSSDLSTSPMSNSGHRYRSSVASHSSSKRSEITSSSSSPAVKLQLKLEPLPGRTSGATASFRRYYLSAQQLSGVSSRNNSSSSSSSSRPPPCS